MATDKTVKMVKIKLPKTRKEQDDVYVGVNGRTWLIKRGEPVEVPHYVAAVLEDREKMLEVALAFEAQAQAKAGAEELK